MNRKFTIEVNDDEVDVMDRAQYHELRVNASACGETPEETGDYTFIRQAVDASGNTVYLGFK